VKHAFVRRSCRLTSTGEPAKSSGGELNAPNRLATRPKRAAPRRPNDLYVTSRSPADVPRTSGAFYPTSRQSIQEKNHEQEQLFCPQLMRSLSRKVSTCHTSRTTPINNSAKNKPIGGKQGSFRRGSAIGYFEIYSFDLFN
jgi:hypothetical protein